MSEWLQTSFEGWTFHHSAPLASNLSTILALHGFSGSGRDFQQLAEDREAPAGRLWIAPDLPGHGETPALPRSAFGLDAMARTLARFLDHYGLNVHLLGYSMGGRLALVLASQGVQLASLTVIGAHPGIEAIEERAHRVASDRALAQRIRILGSEAFAAEWEAKPLIRTQAKIPTRFLTPLKARRRQQSAEGLARSLEEAGTGVMPPLWDSLDALRTPMLYVVGEEDKKFRILAERLANKAANTTIHTIPDAGHCAHLENSGLFLHIFEKHLNIGQQT